MIYYFDTKSLDPYYNLAFEEYFFNNKKDGETFLILWQNSDTVVLGRYQNVYEEVNLAYAKENNINIVRRNSGGGSVFHDIGNLNYSFILDYNENIEMENLSSSIINALEKLGIESYICGRNDIYVGGLKISGTAQYIRDNKILFHGTLLVNSNLEKMKKVLTRNSKISDSSAQTSKQSTVCNIKSLKNFSIEKIKNTIISQYKEICEYNISLKETEEINLLMDNKYKKTDWNYNFFPECNYKNKKRFKGGTVEIDSLIENNIIKNIEFVGDFFDKKNIKEFEKMFEGVNIIDLSLILDKAPIESYIKDVSSNDILSLFNDLNVNLK